MTHYTPEQAALLEDFKQQATAKGWEFFALVGDPLSGMGASVFGMTPDSPSDSAARQARQAHIEWELQHGIDPNHNRNESTS